MTQKQTDDYHARKQFNCFDFSQDRNTLCPKTHVEMQEASRESNRGERFAGLMQGQGSPITFGELHMRWKHLSLCIGILATPTLCHALAVSWTTEIHPAPAIQNAIVRVYAGNATGFAGGSGTIIDIQHDASGAGGWLCVLTADHVIAPATGAGAFTQVAFGDAGGGGLTFDSRTITVNSLRGPMFDTTHRVDLGLLGVRVADLTTLPDINIPFIGTPRIGSHTSYISGYGLTATLNPAMRRYEVSPGTYGTQLTGFSGWIEQPVFEFGDYKYEAVLYATHFGPTDPSLPATDGTAHPLPGDSGGPSWSMESFTWTVNGVHSVSSKTTLPDGSEVVTDGMLFRDVRVASYSDWVTTGCVSVVPEPGSIVVIVLGTSAILMRRRKSNQLGEESAVKHHCSGIRPNSQNR